MTVKNSNNEPNKRRYIKQSGRFDVRRFCLWRTSGRETPARLFCLLLFIGLVQIATWGKRVSALSLERQILNLKCILINPDNTDDALDGSQVQYSPEALCFCVCLCVCSGPTCTEAGLRWWAHCSMQVVKTQRRCQHTTSLQPEGYIKLYHGRCV